MCGYPPFDNEDSKTLFKKIMKGSYEFNSSDWDAKVTENAKVSDESIHTAIECDNA